MTEKEKAYKDFDEEYERLEINPYNASQNYFNSGWDMALFKMEELFVNGLTMGMKSNDVIELFRSIRNKLGK